MMKSLVQLGAVHFFICVFICVFIFILILMRSRNRSRSPKVSLSRARPLRGISGAESALCDPIKTADSCSLGPNPVM